MDDLGTFLSAARRRADLATDKLSYDSPPVLFETATGMAGIATPWKMPAGMPHDEVERLIRTDAGPIFKSEYDSSSIDVDAYSRLTKWFDIFADLNPGLEAIRYARRDAISVAYATVGITSQFNLDDIKFFLATNPDERCGNAPLMRRTNIIEIRTATHMYWEASGATLGKIEKQLEGRPEFELKGIDASDRRLSMRGFGNACLQNPAILTMMDFRPLQHARPSKADSHPPRIFMRVVVPCKP